jgi:hypothetical protein
MQRRLHHWRHVSGHALVWVREVGKVVLLILGFCGFVASAILISFFHAPPWIVALVVLAVLLLALEEGSFRAWDEKDKALLAADLTVPALQVEIQWLRRHAVTNYGDHLVSLDAICLCVADLLPTWTRDEMVWHELETGFAGPDDKETNYITGAITTLVGRGLVERP